MSQFAAQFQLSSDKKLPVETPGYDVAYAKMHLHLLGLETAAQAFLGGTSKRLVS